MDFNGSGGLMFLIIAGLWLWVFVPTWFKRSQERNEQKTQARSIRNEIRQAKKSGAGSTMTALAEQNYRLQLTRRIFNFAALFALSVSIGSIFLAVSQIFYLIVTLTFFGLFVVSGAISRAAKRKSQQVLSRSAKTRSAMFDAASRALKSEQSEELIGENPVNIRDWEASPLPAPKQRIGELEQPTLAEVVGIEELATAKSQNLLDATALDEILRRRRANG